MAVGLVPTPCTSNWCDWFRREVEACGSGIEASMTGPSERALKTAREETRLLVARGAEAVILTGSHARGDATEHSDLDLRTIGEGPKKRLKRSGDFLVSISWMSLSDHESGFCQPGEAGSIVPGWTNAIVLHDPDSLAARLQERAESWKWEEISDDCDRWVAQEITELAEEIHTVVGNIQQDKPAAAAAERAQLAMGLAHTLSVHHRISYESENDLWDLVAESMSGRYGELQRRALAQDPISLKDSIGAVMQLFAIAAAKTQDLLDEDQRQVVKHACDLAGYPLPS